MQSGSFEQKITAQFEDKFDFADLGKNGLLISDDLLKIALAYMKEKDLKKLKKGLIPGTQFTLPRSIILSQKGNPYILYKSRSIQRSEEDLAKAYLIMHPTENILANNEYVLHDGTNFTSSRGYTLKNQQLIAGEKKGNFNYEPNLLGRGRIKKVKIAQDVTTKKLMACQIISKKYQRKFNHESEIHFALDIPIDSQINNDKIYFFQPLIEGVNLYFYIIFNTYKLSINECIELTIQLLEELNKLHEKGIIHNDLHADNIRYSSKEKKLTIFDYDQAILINKTQAVEYKSSQGAFKLYPRDQYTDLVSNHWAPEVTTKKIGLENTNNTTFYFGSLQSDIYACGSVIQAIFEYLPPPFAIKDDKIKKLWESMIDKDFKNRPEIKTVLKQFKLIKLNNLLNNNEYDIKKVESLIKELTLDKNEQKEIKNTLINTIKKEYHSKIKLIYDEAVIKEIESTKDNIIKFLEKTDDIKDILMATRILTLLYSNQKLEAVMKEVKALLSELQASYQVTVFRKTCELFKIVFTFIKNTNDILDNLINPNEIVNKF